MTSIIILSGIALLSYTLGRATEYYKNKAKELEQTNN